MTTVNGRSVVRFVWVALAVGVLGCGSGSKPTGPQTWTGQAPLSGVISGRVLQADSDQPVAGAIVDVGTGTPITTGADGRFEAMVSAGRHRVTVTVPGFLPITRDLAIGEATIRVDFRMARMSPPQSIGAQGGTLTFGDASLEVPPGAYLDASVAVTLIGRDQIGAVSAPAQFIDESDVPRRVVMVVVVSGSTDPLQAIFLRVPVPPGVSVEALSAFRLDANGLWADAFRFEGVANGIATFRLTRLGVYSVAVDSRTDPGGPGYVVTDSGDSGLESGRVLGDGFDFTTHSSAVVLVDPQGTSIYIAPNSRLITYSPIPLESLGDGGVGDGGDGGDAGGMHHQKVPVRLPFPPLGNAVVPYAGRMTLVDGLVQFVLSQPRPKDKGRYRLLATGQTVVTSAREGAYSIRICGGSADSKVDRVQVIDGSIDTWLQGKDGKPATQGTLQLGQFGTFCDKCQPGAAPSCPAGSGPGGGIGGGGGGTGGTGVGGAGGIPSVGDAGSGDGAARDGATDATNDKAGDGAGKDGTVDQMKDVAVAPADGEVISGLDGSFMQTNLDAATAPDMAPLAVLRADRTAIAFGRVAIDGAGAQQTITLTNGRPSPVTPAVSVTGPDAGAFAITGSCSGALAPNASCTVTVRFAPATAGARTAALSIGGDPAGNLMVALSGTGVGAPKFELAPLAGVDFGPVGMGTSSAEATVTVSNSGGLPTALPMIKAEGADAADFSISGDCATPLAPGGFCTVRVRFSPGALGPRAATLTVTGMPGGMAMVSLGGVGLAAAALVASPTKHDFGFVLPGTSSNVATFTITNTGAVASGVPDVRTSDSVFSINNNGCTAPLAPQASCTIGVTFAPTSGGRSGSLLVSATPGGMTAVSLSGAIITPGKLEITPDVQDFGARVTGTSNAATLTVVNRGVLASEPVTVALSGQPGGGQGGSSGSDSPFQIASNSCSGPLSGGQTCAVVVTFAPTVVGIATASLDVPGASAALSGQGVLPPPFAITAVGVANGAYDFSGGGQMRQGVVTGTSTAPVTFTVTNAGLVSSGMMAISLTGPSADEFEIVSATGCAMLDPGRSCTVTALFAPTVEGNRVATLAITSASGGTGSLLLQGLGVFALGATPTPIDFGMVTLNATKETLITVKNQSAVDIGPLTVALASGDVDQFAVAGDGCTAATLAPQQSCVFTARFAPTTGGSKSASVTIGGSGAGIGAQQTIVSLGGVGANPSQFSITPAMDSFDFTSLGATSPTHTFTIQNSQAPGTQTAEVNVTTSPDFPIVTGDCRIGTENAVLRPGQSCSIVVAFAPKLDQAIGARSGFISAAGGGGIAVAQLTGNATPPLVVTPDQSSDFGNVALGDSSTRSFTLTNRSNTPAAVDVKIGEGFLGGPSVSSFAITNKECLSDRNIPAHSTCTIQVQMTPKALGSTSAVLQVSSGVGGFAASQILIGMGVPDAQIVFPGFGAPNAASIDFGSIPHGVTSAVVPVIVANIGGVSVTDFLGQIESSRGAFRFAANSCSVNDFPPDTTCQFDLVFDTSQIEKPPGTSTFSGTLTAAGNRGSGAGPLELAGTNIDSVNVYFTPNPVVVGSTFPGSSGGNSIVTLTNGTSGSMDLDAPVLSPPFRLDEGGTCAMVGRLPAGGSCTLNVKIDAAADAVPGMKSGTLTFGDATASLFGLVRTPAKLKIVPVFGAQDYGTVAIGQSRTGGFLIRNVGEQTAGPVSFTVGGQNPAEFPLTSRGSGCVGQTLQPGATCSAGLDFVPSATGPRSATFAVGGVGGGDIVTMTGTGAALVQLSASPSSLSFNTSVGSEASQTVTIVHPGNSPLGASSLVFALDNTTDFRLGSGCSAASQTSLDSKGTCALTIIFQPHTTGMRAGTLTVRGQDLAAPNLVIPLSGTTESGGH